MSDILNDIVTSKAAEDIAGGTEALFRGLLPKGTFNALEVGLGGAKQSEIDARAQANAAVNKTVEFGGQLMRDSAAIALAGPAALYGVAALNTVGETAQDAVNHDPNLTVEHVAHRLAGELLGASAGLVGGAVAGKVIGAAAKAVVTGGELTGRAVSSAGRWLTEGVEQRMGQRAAKLATDGAELPEINKAVSDMLENGTFSKGRAAALEHIALVRQQAQQGLKDMLAPFDGAATAAESASPAAKEVVQRVAKLPSIAEDFALLHPEKKTLSAETLTPSDALHLESVLERSAKEASKVGRADKANELLGTYQQVRPLTEKFMAERGLSPAEVRQMQSEILAQDAVEASIPTKSLPTLKTLGSAGVKSALKVGAVEAVGKAANLVGVPGFITSRATGVALGAMGLKGSEALAKDIGPAVLQTAEQKAYNVGAALSNFDRSVFAQHFANLTGNDLMQAAGKALVQGATIVPALTVSDDVLANLQALGRNPEGVLQATTRAADKAPIPDEHKPEVIARVADTISTLAKELPQPDPMAPPGARSLPRRKERQLARTLQALTDPGSVVQNPTKEGIQALQRHAPATHAALVKGLVEHAGPNVGPGTHARRILDAMGFNADMANASRMAQKLYAPPPPPPGRSGPKPRAVHNTSVTINQRSTASTAVDDVEKGNP